MRIECVSIVNGKSITNDMRQSKKVRTRAKASMLTNRIKYEYWPPIFVTHLASHSLHAFFLCSTSKQVANQNENEHEHEHEHENGKLFRAI